MQNDPHFVKARNRPLGADSDVAGGRPLGTYSTGFEVALEREGSNGIGADPLLEHGVEAIGWAAFQHGKGSIGGDLYQASITGSVVTHEPSTGGIAFCAGFEEPPLFFGNMATHHGPDASQLRLSRGTTAAGASVYVQEENCSDDEMDHTTEVISYLALQSGPHKVRATMQAPPNVPPVSEMVVCDATYAGPDGTCCSDFTDPECTECWAFQGRQANTATTCTDRATSTFNLMNDVCCPKKGGCDTGSFPSRCEDDCAALWLPIWEDCGSLITTMFASAPEMASSIGPFSDACVATFFGSGGGRCDDDYWNNVRCCHRFASVRRCQRYRCEQGLQLIINACPDDQQFSATWQPLGTLGEKS